MLLYLVDIVDAMPGEGLVYPRLPQGGQIKGENNTIPRIWLSDSIENCLTGIGANKIEHYSDPDLFGWDNGDLPFTIYTFDTNDMDQQYILTPEQLDELGYVPDAYITHEYWYLKPIKPRYKELKALKSYAVQIEYLLPKYLRDRDKSDEEVKKYIEINKINSTLIRSVVTEQIIPISDYK